jgi:hypothetical protein
MIGRRFINGHTVTTYKVGNVYETTVFDKYGIIIRSRVDFTPEQARATNDKFCNLC